jgi:hypothetical protein
MSNRNMMYVDNGNIFAQGPMYHTVEQKLRECYVDCHTWCLKVGMTIEPEKVEVLFFTCL